MEPLASPIHLPVRPSKTITSLVYGSHVAIILILLVAFTPSAQLFAAVACVIISLALQHRARTDTAKRVSAVLLASYDRWFVVTPQGGILAASLSPTMFVSPRLVILFLRPRGDRQVQIVLTDDNAPRDAFRRLRVRLRLPM